jgi:hypothetical protein
MADDLKDAVALLRRKRAVVQALVEKYDRALAALLAIEDETPDGALGAVADSAPTSPAAPGGAPAPRPSVVTLAASLLDEGDRMWTVGTIIEEYAKRGTPITSADPASALRTALSTLVQRGDARRESPGFYRSAKFVSAAGSSHDDEPAADDGTQDPSEVWRLTGS